MILKTVEQEGCLKRVVPAEYMAQGVDVPSLFVHSRRKLADGSAYGLQIDLERCGDCATFRAVCAAVHDDEARPSFVFSRALNLPAALEPSELFNPVIFHLALSYYYLSDDQRAAFDAYCAAFSPDLGEGDVMADFRARYVGRYASPTDYARAVAKDRYNVFDTRFPWDCVDYELLGQKMMEKMVRVGEQVFEAIDH